MFFRIIGPWTIPSRMTPAGTSNSVPLMIIIYVALIAACVLGWHNVRTGRADLRGATTLSVIYFVCLASAKLLVMHHTATIGEINGFWSAIGSALVNGAINWLFYVALEPWVRRKWPRTMISWTRYTSKGASDPLVGRDLLYGTLLGALLTLGDVAAVAFHGNNRHPAFPPLNALLGVRAELSGVIASLRDAIFTAMLFFFLLFLLRLLLRKDWIAGAAFVAIITFATNSNTTTPWVDYPLGVLAFAIFAVALLRFGLLAAIVTSAVGQILDLGGMLDFSAWYSGMAVMPFVLIVAAGGVRLPRLAGRPQAAHAGTVDSACSRSAIRSSVCSSPMESAQQVLRRARSRTLDAGAVLDQAVRPAQAGGADEELASRRHAERGLARSAYLEREHAPERRHLPRRHFVPGVVRQSRIVHLLHRAVFAEESRHPHGVFRLRAHPPGQGIDAPQRQPAIERRRHAAAIALRFARAFEQVVLMPRDQRPADHIAVPADVLRRGVHHHVDPAIERLLQHRRGERAVADRDDVRSRQPRQRRDRRQVRHLHQRIRRRLHPNQARVAGRSAAWKSSTLVIST